MNRRTTGSAVVLALIAAVSLHGATVSRQQADTFVRKLTVIRQHAESARPANSRRTAVTETELNSWFAYHGKPVLPNGVTEPKVTIVGNGKVIGGATVDLEAIGRKRSTGGAIDPWSLLGGRLPITVTGVLHSRDGMGRFELQEAEVSGIPFPKTLLQELLTYYSRTAENPQGLRLDDVFELPANIRQIEVGQGQAVVVQ